MTVQEFLTNIPTDEITRRLRLLDQSLMSLHQNGLYVVCNIKYIEIINNNVTLESFKNKVDYLNSGYNPNGDKQDIIELGSIGICAYNEFSDLYSEKEFIRHLMDNLDRYIYNGKVPPIMASYYETVFGRGKVIYLNIFLLSTDIDVNARQVEGSGRGAVMTKSTPVGRALSEKEAAFAQVLALPAILVIVYICVMACYFIFFK